MEVTMSSRAKCETIGTYSNWQEKKVYKRAFEAKIY